MTREELKEHCERQIQRFERVEKIMPVTPNDWKRYEEHKLILELLEQEPCEDTISRKSIKQKLQEHHDFFVNAYGGFSNLPQNDKSRVDEITNCIAMVVNEPSVTPQPEIRKWIDDKCSVCGKGTEDLISSPEWYRNEEPNFCPFCGVKLESKGENK